ncbi:heme exporter protein CcmD [Edaphovirga cremea]|uniref:heme exporter protein CcmD n=1 Tax=Edaphovirga cremea TaxID=2267246 RepID=UPI000DEF1AFB|nr:heme exporter protein CcmD [Edaphovirga cremea]
MNSAFPDWQAFFAMGGYAFYVWLAVACTLVPLLGLLWHTLRSRRQLLNDIRRDRAREARIRQSKKDRPDAVGSTPDVTLTALPEKSQEKSL